MAGSELDGLDGADGDMFNGAIWVLTPVEHSEDLTLVICVVGRPLARGRSRRR